MKTRIDAGFTLIELLIVIAIIGILAAVLIPNLLKVQKKGYDAGAQSCGKAIQTALAMAYVDNQTYAIPTPTVSKTMVGAAAACSQTQITVTAGTATQNDYSFTVTDSRGTRTYTFTPTTINGAGS